MRVLALKARKKLPRTLLGLRLFWSKIYLFSKNNKQIIGEHFSKRPFFFTVILPCCLYALYMLFYQSPMYESVSRISIENNKDGNGLMLNIGFMGQGPTDDTRTAYLAKSFIESQDMLEKLNKAIAYDKLMSNHHIDYFSRLSEKSNNQQKLNYYQNKLHVVFDHETSELIIKSQAFSAKMAQVILQQIIKETKYFINHVSNTLAEDRFQFCQAQLTKYKEKLYNAELKMIHFQNKNGIFDPKEMAKGVSKLMEGLKERLVTKQTELFTLSAFMQPTASKIIALKEEIKSIKQQISMQTKTLLGEKEDKALNTLMADFEWQTLNLKFAYAEYEAAQKAFDLASLDKAKQQNLLVILSNPFLPDDKSSPIFLSNLFLAFLVFILIFIVGKMAFIIIEEHTD